MYNSVMSRFTNQPDSVHEFLLRLRNATRRKLWKIGGKRVDNPPPVVVVSPGGAGSSLLLKELEKYLVVNSPTDRDGLKHIPRRPRNVSQCILLTGTPVSVVRSLKRRGYLGVHGAKMGSLLAAVGPIWIQEKLLFREIRLQRRDFVRSDLPTLVVDYSELWLSLQSIGEFLGIEESRFVRDFPPQRIRRS